MVAGPLTILVVALVILVVLAIVVHSARIATNARCPACGQRFQIKGLNDMTYLQRASQRHSCPRCHRQDSVESYWRTNIN